MKATFTFTTNILGCGYCWQKGNWDCETTTGELFCGECGEPSVFKLDNKQCRKLEKETEK